jgi:rubrerythrin
MSDNRRLRALERVYRPSQRCQTCHGHPYRLVYRDPETDHVWKESMPDSGCPECGVPIARELVLVMEDAGAPFAFP